ncbi:formylmethanofuran dehydrogenase [Caldimonas sp. KR1-144]|uniref:formylmethanofuran dehydrogenase n=1 Tax=Caldimonas sp. KR1-144 TaxID=3400911 RepID=UPI003C0E8753
MSASVATTPSRLPAWTCPFCALLCDDVSLDVDAQGVPSLAGGRCPRASAALARFGAAAPVAPSVDGQPVPLDLALESAAGLLRRARSPLIGGLGSDVAGARAWMRLAAACGAVCDAAASAGQTAALRVLQDRGGYFTTLAELRTRAELIVVVGSAPAERHPRLWERIAPAAGEPSRALDVVLLGVPDADAERARIAQALPSATIAAHPAAPDLHGELATLAALVAGRAVERASDTQRRLAELLRASRYAVLLWEPGALPVPAELAIESMQRTIGTLNLTTRAAGFVLGGGDGAATAQQVHAWQTGLPLRTRHGPLGLEHDPWRHGAAALAADGAIDALLWIASHGTEPPPPEWAGPLVLLGHPSFAPLAQGRAGDSVFIPVATPGIGHGGHQFRAEFSVLMPLTPARSEPLPSVAEIVARLTAKVRST